MLCAQRQQTSLTRDSNLGRKYTTTQRPTQPQAAELFGGERVWTYSFGFNETDAKIVALEYEELGECIAGGQPPEVTGEEAWLDLALNYAPFEAGRLGRPVTLDDLIEGRADAYQREIDEALGILNPAAP